MEPNNAGALELSAVLGVSTLTAASSEDIERCRTNPKWTCQEAHNNTQPIGCYRSRFLVVKCNRNDCRREWAICLDCSKQRSYLTTKQKISRHHQNNHRRQKIQKMNTPEHDTFQSMTNMEPDDEGVVLPDDDMAENDNDITHHCSQYEATGNDDQDQSTAELSNYFETVAAPDKLGFIGDKNVAYFEQLHLSKSLSGGFHFLVKKSFIGAGLRSKEIAAIQLPPGHAELQLQISHLCFLLTKSECQLLATIMEGCYKVGCEDGYSTAQTSLNAHVTAMPLVGDYQAAKSKLAKLSRRKLQESDIVSKAQTWSTRIPKNWNELRTLHIEGVGAIIPNLPIPVVQKVSTDHSYVSIVDCIRHFLAHHDVSDIATISDDTQMTQCLSSVNHASSSLRAQKIFTQATQRNANPSVFRSYILLWSDDVEPNRTKSNRGSIWLLTATIATRSQDGHCMANTYPLAIARKNLDHEPVIKRLEEDMEKLRSGEKFYIGAARKTANFQFEMFAAIQDQPERRDFNCLRAGNGIHSSRFGVSADHYALYKDCRLQACSACLQTMQANMNSTNEVPQLPSCSDCLNWDVLSNSGELGFYPPPKTYPTCAPNEPWYKSNKCCRLVVIDQKQYLRPFVITYDSLKAAVDFVHGAFCERGWTHAQCASFLQVEGLDDKFIEKVLSHSGRVVSLREAERNPDEFGAIIDDAKKTPDKYKKIQYPAPWMRPTIGLNLHPDVIMHLLFLGVVKTVTMRIHSWLSDQQKLASFLRSVSRYFDGFTQMTVDWLAILPYKGGKLGGWVSENFLGFSRIMPWFYQNIENATKSKNDDEPPPNLPQPKWTFKQNKYWLQQRKLDISGKKEELSERVANLLAKPNPPQALADVDLLPSDVEEVVLALAEVLRCVMKMTVTPDLVNRCDHAVRLFLSKYDRLCAPLEAKTPPVLSSYNFICLLNLPNAMETFGPLRCLWEGGPRGEGFARFSKPFMKEGVYQYNWHHNLLVRLLRAKTFECLAPKNKIALASPSEERALRDRKGSFHKYDSEYSFKTLLTESKRPVSVIIAKLHNNEVKLFGVVGDYDSVISVSLVGGNVSPVSKFGLSYFLFQLDNPQSIAWNDVRLRVMELGFGMLLPLLEDKDSEGRFALISSNWEALSLLTPLLALID